MPRSRTLILCALLLGLFALGPAAAAQTGDIVWGQFQGGAAHEGTASQAPAPPFARAWRFDAHASASVPVIAGGLAVTVTPTRVVAVDLADGTEAWSVPRTEGPVSAPAVVGGGGGDNGANVAFVQGTGTEALLRFVTLSGRADPVEPIELGTGSHSGVSATPFGLAVGDDSGEVHLIDPAGEETWSVSIGAGIVDAPPAADDSGIYATIRNDGTGRVRVSKLDAQGKTLWSYGPKAAMTWASALTVADGRVVFGAGDRTVRSLDAAKGTLQWQSLIRAPSSIITQVAGGEQVVLIGSPAFAGGRFYVADASGGIYGLDPATGRPVYDYQFATAGLGESARTSPLVAADVVLVGLQDGRLVALREDEPVAVWSGGTGRGALFAGGASADTVIFAKGGAHGGLIAYHHAAGGLVEIPSAFRVDRQRALASYVVAFIVVFAFVLAVKFALGFFRRSDGAPVEEASGDAGDETDENPDGDEG